MSVKVEFIIISKDKMGKLLYSGVLLLCFAGLVRSQYCQLAEVPVQENFNEEGVIIITTMH